MNLTRALDVSLPDLPRRQFRESYFRFNPETIWREHKEPKHTIITALSAKTRKGFVFTPEQWELVRLFDGRRNYQQIASLWKEKCGATASVETIRNFAENLDLGDFWYKTPQEESAALALDVAEKRRALIKKKKNLTRSYLWHFDADVALTKAHRRLRWMWSRPFVIASIVALIAMVTTWIVRWDEVWRDTLLYWNMTEKTGADIAAFYLLFGLIGFVHEAGHAFTAKNFGAEVHRTGLMTVYTTPAFFVDTVEVWVFGTRMQRIYTVLAGFWFELMLCAVATFVWWATTAGSGLHDFAYKIILIGGIMPVLFNMNPLTKLDGYLCFCEIIRIQNLKEKAQAFLSAWLRRYIFHMPATVPSLPRRRAIFFFSFAVLSGCYSYMMLTFLARLTYKIMLHYTPEWAFLPATLMALRIFRTRIEKFLAFCKELYLSKKEFLTANWKSLAPVGAVVLALMFVPLFREKADAPFVIEPSERVVLRANSPSLVQSIFVKEGDTVTAGAPIAGLRSLAVDSAVARAGSGLRTASARATDAQLRNTDYATAEPERRQWSQQVAIAADRRHQMDVVSPIAGTIVTPHVEDLRSTWIDSGATIAEVQDVSTVRARVFIPEPDMRVLTRITGQSLRVYSSVAPMQGKLASISPSAQTVDPGLIPANKYKGLAPPAQYVALVTLPNQDGALRSGMTGEAKIFGIRRSVAGMTWQMVADFVGRKIW